MVLGSDSSVFIFLVPFQIKKGKKEIFCLSLAFTVHRFKFFDVILAHNFFIMYFKKRLHNINDKQAV